MTTNDVMTDETRDCSRRGLLRFMVAGVAVAGLGSVSRTNVAAREAEPGDDHGGNGNDDRPGDDHGRHHRRRGRGRDHHGPNHG